MAEFKIKTEYIKLDQFLKFAAIAESGGHAKIMISDGEIKVNGEICLMRGKKLYKGDKVTVKGNKEEYIVSSEG